MLEKRKIKLCRPDYFVVGVRKGGTTALHTYITKHEAVFPFKVQIAHHMGEAVTISRSDVGKTKFNRMFAMVRDDQLVGDASPNRLVENGAGFLTQKCPGSRIFILIRDPVERAISNIKMRLRNKKTKCVFALHYGIICFGASERERARERERERESARARAVKSSVTFRIRF